MGGVSIMMGFNIVHKRAFQGGFFAQFCKFLTKPEDDARFCTI
jgi:hypothetical protein